MKKNFEKIFSLVLACVLILASVLIAVVYFNFISKKIFEDSTAHLEEIYGQVNSTFSTFVERNWNLLSDWGDRIAIVGDDDYTASFMAYEQGRWGFSEFYFVASDGSYIMPDGKRGALEEDCVPTGGEPVMASGTTSDGEEVTVFSVPVGENEFRGFRYSAVAAGYNNADMAASLKVDAFAGKAKCFVIRSDGSVLLSTQVGGSVFGNFLSYLRACGLEEETLASLSDDWENGRRGLIRCDVLGESSCILYLPIGYRDYFILSSVPMSAVSAGFLSVQQITMDVLVIIFLMVSASIIVLLVMRGRRLSRKNRLELRHRERMFDVLSNSVDDIFIMIDSEKFTVDYLSPNIERLLGIGCAEAKKNIRVLEKCAVNYNVIFPKEELDAIPINGNKYWECEYMHQTTGERRWYRMTIYNTSIGDVRKYVVVMSDRTLEQQMNQKLQEALNAAKSANEAKSNFLSNMSHDIRTPMNAIVGFSVLLEKDADNAEKVREYTRKITASSQHLLSLINDVLDMSKIESGKTSLNVEKFSLPQLFEELNIIIMPQAKAKEQTFTLRVKGAPPEEVIGDKLRVNQILINLLSNAVKYTQNGGKIDFTVCELPDTQPQFSKLRFQVSDNGIGMSEEFQKQVFAPFSREINSVTNKIQGTGLGMAITKNLVDLMGGIITVESKLGEGSTFTVELSFALPEKEEEDMWFRHRVSRMLVADDDIDVCRTIAEMMKDTGVDVEYTTDGRRAVEMTVEADRRGEDFNVILLDWKMPDMDGVETARAIRERVGHHVPILVLTSYDWSEIEDEARQAGINAFMPKPFFTSTFWQVIKPLFLGQADQVHTAKDVPPEIMNGLLFLVAEDNELNAEILTEMLKMEGAECDVAQNGQIAVEMFEASEPHHYDMILMDVQMPVMNGYDATKRIRASSHPDAAEIPIVAMTANTFAEDVRHAFDAGMNGHLAKPIDMAAVRELVGKLTKRTDGGADA